MAYDVPWKSKMSTLYFENVLLKGQVQSVVQERKNIKLEFQKLFNSIKITRAQHQKEVDELIQCVTQKTYAYGDVRAKNQDLLMTISKLKTDAQAYALAIFQTALNLSLRTSGALSLWMIYFAAITDLEVAFRSKTCYVQNLEGGDLLMGSRDLNLYNISISEMAASSLVCLMSRETLTKSWLWHHRLSHLNFGTINQLTSNDLANGLPKLKYTKDHLCSACEQGKSEKASLPPKLFPSTESKLELLHMDLCGPIRVASINGKKYILVIVDDYSRYTWNHSIVHTRHNKTPYELIHGIKPNIQYFHVFGSLCYPTNDHDDLGKMKPKADFGIFISYSESSRGFRIYNRRTKKIMETIHVKFDELTTCSQEVSDDSAANTPDNDHTSSSSSIVVDQDDVPLVVSSSDEQVSTVPNFLVMNEVADEFVQEDVADFDGNMFHNAP
ncbi:retrovirus-related pol polyprotein from transposon TNT 1-94 [Tanacetum coccineum]